MCAQLSTHDVRTMPCQQEAYQKINALRDVLT
jgi:hypothetical protein